MEQLNENGKDFINLLKNMGRLIPVENGKRVVVLEQELCLECRPPGKHGCHKVQLMDSLSVFYAVGYELSECKK